MNFQYVDRAALIRGFSYGKIVDIGCCIGDMFGSGATNVDILSLEEIKTMAKPRHGDIDVPNFVQADAVKLPFSDFEFDCANLSEILEHVDDPVAVLNEAQRVARYIIISVPNEYRWSPDKKPFSSPLHKRAFTRESMLRLLAESELKILHLMELEYLGWAYFIVTGFSKSVKMEGVFLLEKGWLS